MAQGGSVRWLSIVGVLSAALPGYAAAQARPSPQAQVIVSAPALPTAPSAPAEPVYLPPPSSPSAMSFAPAGSPGSTTYQSGQPVYDQDSEDDAYDDDEEGGGYQAPPVVQQAPPPVIQETVPVAPAPSYVWAPGYWYWYGSEYSWVPGRWIAPHPGYFYSGPRWDYRSGYYNFVPGGWAMSIGGPVAYPIYMHSWRRPGYYGYSRGYVAPFYGSRRYGSSFYSRPRGYGGPPHVHHRDHYVAPPARSFRGPDRGYDRGFRGPGPGSDRGFRGPDRGARGPDRARQFSAPPLRGPSGGGGRYISAPPSRGSGGGGRHYSAPPSRGPGGGGGGRHYSAPPSRGGGRDGGGHRR